MGVGSVRLYTSPLELFEMKRSRSQVNIIVTAEPAAKKKRSSKSTRVQKWPLNGVAATARARLRYSCEVSATSSGTIVVACYNFAINNLYDPDSTGVGAQPVGFDQWMTLYGLYTVVGGKVSVHPITNGSSTTTPQYYALCTGDLSYPLASVQAFISSCPSSNPGQTFTDLGIHRGALSTEYVKERSRSLKWTVGGIMGMP